MGSQHKDPLIAAAITLWDRLAAFSWEQFMTNGRGVVLIDELVLEQAADSVRAGGPIDTAHLPLGYVCARDVPPSDDFAPIIAECDPNRQVALLIRLRDGDERLYILETSERQEQLPPRTCYERLTGRGSQS
jgi:hypothetical protein